MSRRDCHLVGVKNEDLDEFIEEIKTFLKWEKIPDDYAIDVYKDTVEKGVFVEMQGPRKEPLKDLDSMIYAKIIEICERKGIEHHIVEPVEVVKIEEG